jgi:hypothetical protein
MFELLAQATRPATQPADLYNAFSNVSSADIPHAYLMGLAGLMIVWGAVNLFMGWRIIKVVLGIYGVIAGAAAGAMLGSQWGTAGLIGGAIGGGAVCGVACYLLVYVVVFLLGAGVGFGVMMTIMPSQSMVMLIIGAAVALACGLVAFHFREIVLMVFTSLAGASQVTNGIWFFLGHNLPNAFNRLQGESADPVTFMQQYKLALICYGALSLIGILSQHAMYKKYKSAQAQARQDALAEEATAPADAGGALPTFNKTKPAAQASTGRPTGAPGSPAWAKRLPKLPLVRVSVLVITMGLVAAAVWSEAAAQDLLAEAQKYHDQGLTEEATQQASALIDSYPVSFAVIDARQILADAPATQPTSQPASKPTTDATADSIRPTGMYWQPLAGGLLVSLAGVLLMITRRHNRLLLLGSFVLLALGALWTLGQLAWYEIYPIGPLGSLAGMVMEHPMVAYIVSYGLLAVAIAMALTPQPDAPESKLDYVDDDGGDIEWV